jgi:hypothetical protein
MLRNLVILIPDPGLFAGISSMVAKADNRDARPLSANSRHSARQMDPIDRLGDCASTPRLQRFGFHGFASILMEGIDSSLM